MNPQATNPRPLRPAWRVAGGSATGTRHAADGKGCDDACAMDVMDDVLVLAVADGAGSAWAGGVGASLAVDAAVRSIRAAMRSDRRPLWQTCQPFLHGALLDSRGALEAWAVRRGCPLSDLATTLLVAIAGHGEVAGAQIGDGAIVVRYQAEEELYLTLTEPMNGEYANETIFLTSPAALEAAQISYRIGPVTGVSVFTDGLQNQLLHATDNRPHEPLFQRILGCVSLGAPQAEKDDAIRRFLDSAKIRARTDDDLTLVAAARVEVSMPDRHADPWPSDHREPDSIDKPRPADQEIPAVMEEQRRDALR